MLPVSLKRSGANKEAGKSLAQRRTAWKDSAIMPQISLKKSFTWLKVRLSDMRIVSVADKKINTF
jgi:hypothetical protein